MNDHTFTLITGAYVFAAGAYVFAGWVLWQVMTRLGAVVNALEHLRSNHLEHLEERIARLEDRSK